MSIDPRAAETASDPTTVRLADTVVARIGVVQRRTADRLAVVLLSSAAPHRGRVAASHASGSGRTS